MSALAVVVEDIAKDGVLTESRVKQQRGVATSEHRRRWKDREEREKRRSWTGYLPARGVELEHEAKQARGPHQGGVTQATMADGLLCGSTVSLGGGEEDGSSGTRGWQVDVPD